MCLKIESLQQLLKIILIIFIHVRRHLCPGKTSQFDVSYNSIQLKLIDRERVVFSRIKAKNNEIAKSR